MPDNFPTPSPPVADGKGLPWDVAVDDAVAAIAAARARHGDTFIVDSGGNHYLFTFSPGWRAQLISVPSTTCSGDGYPAAMTGGDTFGSGPISSLPLSMLIR